MELIFQYSPYLIPLCLLLGAVYAFALYWKDKRLSEFSKLWVGILSLVRFLSASLLAILLLSPLVKYISRQVSEPILIIAQDNSQSMVLALDSVAVKTILNDQLEELKKRASTDFEVEKYLFGESLRKTDSSADYQDRYTNFQDLFSELNVRYDNRNVGALLLISDGIFNRGMNPIYSFNDASYPIYVVATGDTNRRVDLLIKNVISNKISFLGNQFPIRAEYKAMKAVGNKMEVQLFHKGKKIASESIPITEDNQFGTVDFLVRAEESGLQSYELRIPPIENESSVGNNTQKVYVDVLDSRQNILLSYQNPHPDIAAIQRAISSSENYKVESKKIDESFENLKSYDLVIIHGAFSRSTRLTDLLVKLRELEKPVLFVVGEKNDWNLINELALPISVNKALNSTNEVYPIYNDAFPLFKLSEEQKKALNTYPPLRIPQASYRIKDQVYTLFSQQIGSVPTQYPLLVFSQNGKNKEGLMLGEGFWRWRIDNYASFGNHRYFDEIITKIVQYLSVKQDKSYFRLSHEKEVMENEKLRFDLQLFNKAYDPVNDPDAYLEITDEDGKRYDYQFNRSSNAYFIELSGLKVGNFSYRAYTSFDQERMEEKGSFSIREIKVENVQLLADHNLLYQLASKSGGNLLYNLNAEALIDELNAREDIQSLSYTTEDVEDIINLKWIFFVLIFMLSLEWFIRKYQGAY